MKPLPTLTPDERRYLAEGQFPPELEVHVEAIMCHMRAVRDWSDEHPERVTYLSAMLICLEEAPRGVVELACGGHQDQTHVQVGELLKGLAKLGAMPMVRVHVGNGPDGVFRPGAARPAKPGPGPH